MKKFLLIFLSICLLLSDTRTFAQVSAIYAGGPVYYGRDYSIEELKNSGFNTLIVWTIHIDESGDLNFNGEFPLCVNGEYVGDDTYPHFRDDIKELKSVTSSINRIEFGLSAWQSGTYDHIKSLIEAEGTGPDSKLYKNFEALKQAIPEIDAVNNDDEGTYDVPSSVAFHIMLFDLGFKTALVPYTRATSYWEPLTQQVNAARTGAVDRTYLQVYAGGSGNNPCSNQWDFGIPIFPGVWGGSGHDSPTQVEAKMTNWNNSCGISGGFMWLYDDFDNSSLVGQFADAINNSFDITADLPGQITSRSPYNGSIEISVDEDLFWEPGGFGVSNTVYFGENSSLDASHIVQNNTFTSYDPGTLQNNTTYYWKVVQTNSGGSTESDLWTFTTEVITPIPSKPTIVYPTHQINNVSTSPVLQWEEADAAFIYDVYFGTDNIMELISSTRELSIQVQDLESNKRYSWRVDSRNSAGTTEGDLKHFDTRGINLSRNKDVEVSSQLGDAKWHGVNLVDGVFLDNENGEWRSNGEVAPYAQINWDHNQTIGLIILYGSTNTSININNATLSFSDNTSMVINDLPTDGSALVLEFEAKEINWVRLQVDASQGDNVGLAEIEVYEFSDAAALPGQARGFTPLDNESGIGSQVTLRWDRGSFARSHDIYFSVNGIVDESDFFLNKSGLFHVFSDLEEGIYYWRIDEVNTNGTTEGPVVSFVVGQALGIVENENFLKLKVYPNPTSGLVKFQLEKYERDQVTLLIYNNSGKLIIKQQLTSDQLDQPIFLWHPDSRVEAGLYHAVITTTRHMYYHKLIIK